tara:strand:+ start:1387 stop:1716 length:330 start_codon:yes stop_codon:yes gene_type:complete
MESSYVKHLNNNVNRYTNNSPLLAGLAMLMINIGTKYIHLDLSEKQDLFIKSIAFRRLAIFTIFWIGTKDMYSSILLTFLYVIFVVNLFNEESKYYLFSKHPKISKNLM